MIVRCRTNNIASIADKKVRARLFKSFHLDGPTDDLSIGKTYPVIGVIRWDNGGLWVYLHTVEEVDYPYPYPLELFEIVNDSLLSNWVISFSSTVEGVVLNQIGFAEWMSDGNFYERLIDGDETAIAQYKSQRIYLKEMTALQASNKLYP